MQVARQTPLSIVSRRFVIVRGESRRTNPMSTISGTPTTTMPVGTSTLPCAIAVTIPAITPAPIAASRPFMWNVSIDRHEGWP